MTDAICFVGGVAGLQVNVSMTDAICFVGGVAGLQNMMKKFQQGAAGKPGNMF